ncbi:MAG: cohesin domain-containing protein, partial [Candidatus Aminicenantes bacterium]
NYSISDNKNWLSVSPTSGSSQGEENSHTVSVDISGLSAGSYSGTITITDDSASNSPQTVSVSLDISSLPSDNKISISCSPSSGGSDTVVSIPVAITGNTNEITYFGLDLSYDTSVFEFQSVSSGGLTSDWASVDGNDLGSGTIRVGGFAGSGTTIPKGSTGEIAVVKMKVTCNTCNDGKQVTISITNYQDDISGMTPDPATTKFTYNN